MPERIFKYVESLDDLKCIIRDLMNALKEGQTTGLRNSNTGFLKTTAPMTPVEVRNILMDARYEVYMRGRPTPGRCGQPSLPGDPAAAKLEPENPYSEKIMRVDNVSRVDRYMLPPFNASYF
jgi:hypothetical protein